MSTHRSHNQLPDLSPLDIAHCSDRVTAPTAQALLERVIATPRVLDASSARLTSTAPRRHRRAATAAVAGALLLSGGSVAAAAGHLPAAFTQAFAGWTGDWSDNGVAGVDPDTAQRVASMPGPDGTVFTVMSAATTTTDGGPAACTVVVLETADSARQRGPSAFQDVSGNGCQPSLVGQPFGAMSGADAARAADSTLGVTQDIAVWSAAAGEAASAQVFTADGRIWPVVAYQGTLYGWVPVASDEDTPAELVGYAADGREVGRTPV